MQLQTKACCHCTWTCLATAVAVFAVAYFLFFRKKRHHFEKKSNYLVVITGCDTGFGNLASIDLHASGFRVISACLSKEGAEQLKDKVDMAVVCDVTKEDDVKLFSHSIDAFMKDKKCKLWAIVNNAGIAETGNVDWMPLKSFRRVMDVNYFGLVNVTMSLLEELKKTKGSRIINLSSVAGLAGGPMMSSYCGSKHAVEGFSKCLRLEMKPWNVHVCNINPAFMRTPIVERAVENCKRDFMRAPEAIRSQYKDNCLESMSAATSIQEHPSLVVRMIEDLVFEEHPAYNNYPGFGSKAFRVFCTWPEPLQALVTMIINHPATPKPDAIRRIQSEK